MEKSEQLFLVWCVDIIVRLISVASNSSEHVIIAVVDFTKWVEVGVVSHISV